MLSTLYLGMQFVLKTVDEKNWLEMSADLTGYGEQEEPEKRNTDKPRPPAIHRTVTVNRTGGHNMGWHQQPAGSVDPRRRKELAKRLAARINRACPNPLRRGLASRPGRRLSDGGRDA